MLVNLIILNSRFKMENLLNGLNLNNFAGFAAVFKDYCDDYEYSLSPWLNSKRER